MLNRKNTELLILVVVFLKKLSIFKENKDEMVRMLLSPPSPSCSPDEPFTYIFDKNHPCLRKWMVALHAECGKRTFSGKWTCAPGKVYFVARGSSELAFSMITTSRRFDLLSADCYCPLFSCDHVQSLWDSCTVRMSVLPPRMKSRRNKWPARK